MLPELIILPPFLVAFTIAIGLLSGRINGEASEHFTARIAFHATVISFLAVLIAFLRKLPGTEYIIRGTWFESGSYRINISFIFDTLNLAMAMVSATLSLLVTRFSINYMHREAGFHRFFLVLSLFTGAMLLLSIGGNAVLTFVGWELAGITSYLLIAYAYDRTVAAHNATRALVTTRIGDIAFVMGIFFSFLWVGNIEWTNIVDSASEMPA